jgi:fumarate reductase subunit C
MCVFFGGYGMAKDDKSKPYKEPPEYYWFRSTLLGKTPIRREGWLVMLIGYGGFLLCVGAFALAIKMRLDFLAIPLLILAALLLLGSLIISAVRTDRRW